MRITILPGRVIMGCSWGLWGDQSTLEDGGSLPGCAWCGGAVSRSGRNAMPSLPWEGRFFFLHNKSFFVVK